ncbi:hypothetical protein LguiA_012309 [Lonicera macranthoides]
MLVMACRQKRLHMDIGKLAFAMTLNQMSNTIISDNVDDFESKDVRWIFSTGFKGG